MPIINLEDEDPKVEVDPRVGLRVPGPTAESMQPEVDRLFDETSAQLKQDFPGLKFGHRKPRSESPDFTLGGSDARPDFTLGGIDPQSAPPPEPTAAPEKEKGDQGVTKSMFLGAGERIGRIMGFVPATLAAMEDLAPGHPFSIAGKVTSKIPGVPSNRELAETLRNLDFGSSRGLTSSDEIESAWNAGDKWSAAGAAAKFAVQQGLLGIPDMVAITFALPAYFVGQAADYAQQRAANDGRERITPADAAISAVTSAFVAAMERYGAGKVFDRIGGVGKGGIRKWFEGILAETGTELVQNPAELAGTKLGTEKAGEVTTGALVREGGYGALAGAGGGATIGGAVQLMGGGKRPEDENQPPTVPPAPTSPGTPPPGIPPSGPPPVQAAPVVPGTPQGAPQGPVAGAPKPGQPALFKPTANAPGAVIVVEKVSPESRSAIVSRVDPETGDPMVGADGEPLTFVASFDDLEFFGNTQQPVAQAPPVVANPVAQAPPVVANPPSDTSAEPVLDLVGQIKDMQNWKTPRRGVYLSPETVASTKQNGTYAGLVGSNVVEEDFDGQGGTLIVRSKKDLDEARFARDSGMVDMQQIVGQLTGAGIAKPKTAKTAAVVRKDETGASVQATIVDEAQAPAVAEQLAALPGTVEVTTPEAVIAERERLVAVEATPPVPQPKPGDVFGAADFGIQFATQELNSIKEGNLAKTDVRASAQAVGAAAQMLRAAAMDASARGAPPEVVSAIISKDPHKPGVATRWERVGDKPEIDFVKSRGVSEPKLRAALKTIQDAMATLEPYRNAPRTPAPVVAPKGEAVKKGKKPEKPSPPAGPTFRVVKDGEGEHSIYMDGERMPGRTYATQEAAEQNIAVMAAAGPSRVVPALAVVAKEAEARAELPRKPESRFSLTQDEANDKGGTGRWYINDEKTGKSYDTSTTEYAEAKQLLEGHVAEVTRLEAAKRVGPTGMTLAPPGEKVVHRKKTKYVPPKKREPTVEEIAAEVAEKTAPKKVETIEIVPAAVAGAEEEFITELLGATPRELQQEAAMDPSGKMFTVLRSIVEAMGNRNGWTGWYASVTRGGVMSREHRNEMLQLIREYAAAERTELPGVRERLLANLTNIDGKTLPQAAIAAVFDVAEVTRAYTTMAQHVREVDSDVAEIEGATSQAEMDTALINKETGSMSTARENEIGGTARTKPTYESGRGKTLPAIGSSLGFFRMLKIRTSLHPLKTMYESVIGQINNDQWMEEIIGRGMENRLRGVLPGTHEILDGLILRAKRAGPHVLPLVRQLEKIRAAAPNLAAEFSLKDEVDLDEYGRPVKFQAAGRFYGSGFIQLAVQVDARQRPVLTVYSLQNLIHEISHATTVHEMGRNPNGPVAREVKKLRKEIIERAKDKLGGALVDRVLAFYGKGRKAGEAESDEVEKYGNYLYGLTNNDEFLAEVDSSPEFHSLLVSLDQSPTKNWVRQVWDKVVRIYNIALRIKNPADSRLLNDAMVLAARARAAQMGRVNRIFAAMLAAADNLEATLRIPRKKAVEIAANMFVTGPSVNFVSKKTGKRQKIEMKPPRGSKDSMNENSYDAQLFYMHARGLEGNTAKLHRERAEGPPAVDMSKSLEPRPSGRLKNHERIATLTTPRLARALGGVRWLMTSGFMDASRKKSFGAVTTDFIVSRSARLFGPVLDAANPLVAWGKLRHTRISLANQLRELAERTVNAKWLKMTPHESQQLGDTLGQTTLFQIEPDKGISQPQLIKSMSRKKWEAKVHQINAAWAKLSPDQKDLYHSVQKYFKTEYSKIRRAGIDMAIDLFGGKLGDVQRTLLYTLKKAEDIDTIVGPGRLIDLGEGNDKFRKVLNDLIQVSSIKGPYFPLMRKGNLVLEANREGTVIGDNGGPRVFDTKEQALAVAESIRLRAPKNTAKVVARGDKFQVEYKIRNVTFHTSQRDAMAAQAQLRKEGFEVGSYTEKLESIDSVSLSEGLSELISKASSIARADKPNASTEQVALVATLQSAFVQILAERAASASSQLKREGVEGFKGREAHEIFARRVKASSWHFANLKTAMEQSRLLARLRTYERDSTQNQDLLMSRGRVMHEVTKRLQLDADEVNSLDRHNMDFILGQLGYVNFLLTPSYTLINIMQNFNVALPYVSAKYGLKGGKSMLRAMKLVAGPAFGKAMRGMLSKPGEIMSHDVYTAIAKAVSEDPRFARFAESKDGQPSALQQLVDMNVITASFVQELAAVADNQNIYVTRGMEYLRLFPQGAELFNRVTTSLAVLEATNGNVEAAANTISNVHFNYDIENLPRYFRKIGRARLPRSITMFKLYGVSMLQLMGGLVVDAASRRGQSKADRARAASALAGIIAAHALSAGVLRGIMLEPLRLLMQVWTAMFGDDDEFGDLDTAVQNWAVEVTGSELGGRVLSKGVWNALGFDLSGRMGLDRILMYDPPEEFTENAMWKTFGGLFGPLPAMAIQRSVRAARLFGEGKPVEGIMEMIPVRAFQDALKAYQLVTEGVQTTSGETVVSADEFGAWSGIGRAAGFQTRQEAHASDQATTVFAYKGWRTARVRQLSTRYWNAHDAGDAAAEAAAIAAIKQFNQKNPGAPISGQSLAQSKRGAQQAVRERMGEGRNRDLNQMLDY